jgi:predicted XRE-type DNA-binding protein
MSNRRSVEGEYRVEGSVLDELGLDRQALLELKLKAALHQRMMQWVKRRRQNQDQRRRAGVSDPHELMRGKLSTLSVARLLLYADLLGG